MKFIQQYGVVYANRLRRFWKTAFMLLSTLFSIRCKLMEENPIYKYKSSDFFRGNELLVADAIRRNDPHAMEIATRNFNIDLNQSGNHGMTFLYWACAHRHPLMVEKLLRLHANPNQLIDNGKTKSHLVAICAGGKVDRTLELLLQYGGNPNGMDAGLPAVHVAVKARRLDRIQLLLSQKADINIVSESDDSLIQFCALLNQFEMVAYLIEQGADFNRKGKMGGCVALEVQETKGKLDEATEKWRSIVEKMLIQRGIVFPVERPWEKRKK